MPILQGYTTQNDKWEVLQDKELVKHDLLMEIYTQKGECDWEPEFGSTILSRIFQYKNNSVKSTIIEELTNIIDNNEFLSLQDINATEIDKGWSFTIVVSYMGDVPEEWIIPITEETAKEYISNGTMQLI